MPKRSSKPKSDPNQSAVEAVARLTGQEREKNPAAVALGRLGGLKGGKARAAKLGKERLREIARNAAQKRWQKGA